MKALVVTSLFILASFGQLFSNPTAFHFSKMDGICAACNTPTGLAASNATGTTALLSWAAVSDASAYLIEVENGAGNPIIFRVATSVSTSSYTVTGLLPNKAYKFKVRTKCGGNKSSWTEWFAFNSSSGTGSGGSGDPCNTFPSNRTTTNITSTSAAFNWAAVPGVSGYRIRIENASGNPTPFGLTINLPSGTTDYTVLGLQPNKGYKWKIRSLCGTQTSPWSSNLVFTTLQNFNSDDNNLLNLGGGSTSVEQELLVYPNPTAGILNLQFDGGTETVTYKVMNLQGNVETTSKGAAGEQVQLDLSSLQAGIYLISAQSEKMVKTQKIRVE